MTNKRIVIDVREPEDFTRDHVEGAINIPPAEIMNGAKQLEGIDKNTELILYCISGSRSNVCMNYLSSIGFNNVINGINKDQVRAKYLTQ